MKNIFIKLTILLFLAGMSACDDYLDVNDSIDNPNLNELTPNELIVGAQAQTAETLADRINRVGNWMGVAWSGSYLDFNDAYGVESRYQFSSTFYDDVWDDLYTNISNFETIENYNDDLSWNNQKAAAKILKSFYFQYVVDLYGDVPYSQAFDGSGNLFPEYDNAQDIYISLINSIDEAIELISIGSDSESFTGSDIMFSGDMSKWEAFANTVKLRLLVRLALKAEQDASLASFANVEFAKLNGAQFLDVDVSANPGYSDSDDRQNPFWEIYGADPTGVPTNQGRQTGPSKFAFDLLNNSGDPRLNTLWKDNGGAFDGTLQNGSGRAASIGDGILVGADADLPIMLAAESYFLQAEAVLRGYLAGDAQALFNQGVQASFSSLSAGDATAYLAGIDTDLNLGFNGGDALGAILTQKWIALTSVSGAELWIEYNRTGYPDLPLPESLTDPNIPLRLLYPASEYSGNSNNVKPQSRTDAFTFKIFWDVN